MSSFKTCAVGRGHLKFLRVLLLAPALELKQFLLRTNGQTPGFLLRTSAQRAAWTGTTRLLVKANGELGMSMLSTHFLPVDTFMSLWARRLFCRKINLTS